MFKLRAQLDENGLTQLVTPLLAAERDEEAGDVFREWLRERSYRDKDPPEFASPSIIGIWIELAGREPNLESSKLASKVESTGQPAPATDDQRRSPPVTPETPANTQTLQTSGD